MKIPTKRVLWKLFASEYELVFDAEPEKDNSQDDELYQWFKRGFSLGIKLNKS